MTAREGEDADATPDLIRHLAAASHSSRIAIAAFKRTAATLQIDGSEHSGPFDTVLDGSRLVVASDTGETLEQIRGVMELVESPYAPLALLVRRRPTVVRMPSRSSVFEVERTTFAFLSIAFGSAALAVIWSYERGGDQRLVRFVPRGRPKLVRNVGAPAEACFGTRGSELFTSRGDRIAIATGRAEKISGFHLDAPRP